MDGIQLWKRLFTTGQCVDGVTYSFKCRGFWACSDCVGPDKTVTRFQCYCAALICRFGRAYPKLSPNSMQESRTL